MIQKVTRHCKNWCLIEGQEGLTSRRSKALLKCNLHHFHTEKSIDWKWRFEKSRQKHNFHKGVQKRKKMLKAKLTSLSWAIKKETYHRIQASTYSLKLCKKKKVFCNFPSLCIYLQKQESKADLFKNTAYMTALTSWQGSHLSKQLFFNFKLWKYEKEAFSITAYIRGCPRTWKRMKTKCR